MNDAQHFILEHFDTIHNSPLHIYSYALPFSPPSCWLHKYYRAELLQGIRVIKGIPAEWRTHSHTVFLGVKPFSLAYWKDTIAVGLGTGDIIILNAITGSQVAVLSGHVDEVKSVAFSWEGTFLVSGGCDKNVKLWDVQTGGVFKTFCGHTDWILSVSISPDCATIASGSRDRTIHLWHTPVGDCFCVIDGFNDWVESVGFSPTNSQLLISACNDNTVQQWNINGCQIGPTHEGQGVAFSSDGTHFVSWGGQFATVHSSGSIVVVAELQVSDGYFECCCFSPDGELVAGGVDSTVYVWNITGPDPHLIETFIGHSDNISSLIFAASPISGSGDNTVKFWQIGVPSAALVATGAISTSPEPSSIQLVSLQVRDGVAISSDLAGVVKTWDILTGLCKASFQTPAKGHIWGDVQLVESRLLVAWVVIWDDGWNICIWDAEKSEPLQRLGIPTSQLGGIRISGDGSKVFCLIGRSIQAWDIQTGEAVGKVELEDYPYLDPLHVGGSKIWICFQDSSVQRWDFEISGSSHILLSNTFPDRPHLNFIWGARWETGSTMIKDVVTGKEIFQLVGRYARPCCVQWDGQYLVAGYESGELLILAFDYALLQ